MSKQERVAGIKLEGAIQQSLPSGWTLGGSGGGPPFNLDEPSMRTIDHTVSRSCTCLSRLGSYRFFFIPLVYFSPFSLCGVRRSSCQGISWERMALSNPVVLVRGNGSGGAVINGSRFQAPSGLKVRIQEIVWGNGSCLRFGVRVAVSVSGSSINLRHHHVGEGWVGSNSIIAKYQCQCRHVGILFFIVVNISLKKKE